MRPLLFNIEFPSLSELTPLSSGQYRFIVTIKDSGGVALVHPRLGNYHVIELVPITGAKFQLSVPNTLSLNDDLQNLIVTIYRHSTDNCCEIVVPNVDINDVGGSVTPTGCEYTVTPNLFTTIINNNGVYSETYVGDYEQGGVTYRQANGRTYRVFYWLNEHPWANEIGGQLYPKSFKNVTLKNGLMHTLRKVYIGTSYVGTYSGIPTPQTYAELNGIHMWYSSWANEDGDQGNIYKTSMTNFTTCNGNDLVEGDIEWKKNPEWLRSDRNKPQYFLNPADNVPDKPFTAHFWPQLGDTQNNPVARELTFKTLKEAGVTHVWYVPYVGMTGDDNPVEGIRVSHMLGTQDFHNRWPDYFPAVPNYDGKQITQPMAIEYANSIDLSDYCIITDEFSEGSYAQFAQARGWIYERLEERATTEINPLTGNIYVGIQILGEYGYGSLGFGWGRLGNPTDTPMSTYYQQMVGNEATIAANIENIATSNWTTLKQFKEGDANFRGTCISAYYSIEHTIRGGIGQYLTAYPFQAIVFYNYITNDKPAGLFTWDAMQSNVSSIDIWQKDDSIPPGDGREWYPFPKMPAEILRIQHFISMLLFDSLYVWGNWNKDLNDDNAWKSDILGSWDSGAVGVRWYSDLITKLNAASGVIQVSDYKVNGVNVLSTTTERRISNITNKYANNIYFNECAEYKRGWLMVIDDGVTTPSFIYCNPYKNPSQVETIIALWDGDEYDLGEVVGTTLFVTNN